MALHRAAIWSRYPISKQAVEYLSVTMLVWDAILGARDSSDESIVETAVALGVAEDFARDGLEGRVECKDHKEFLEWLWRNEEISQVRDEINAMGIKVPPELMIEAVRFCTFHTVHGALLQGQADNLVPKGSIPADADRALIRSLLQEKEVALATVASFFRERWQFRYGIAPDQAARLVEALRKLHVSNVNPSEMSWPRIKRK